MSSAPPAVLAFAASDPSGGAGVQADLLTLASLGCHPLSVITALTVQDSSGVDAIIAVDADWVERQAVFVLEDMPAAAFKIGVLGSVGNIAAIARVLSRFPDTPLVVDPVIASGRGDPLASDAMLEALLAQLAPRASVLTPNAIELERLGGVETLLASGCRHVLVTGTHAASPDVVNRLYDASGLVREDRWPRLDGNYHGSGCTLASAIAAFIARGRPVSEAVGEAQRYTWQALAGAIRPGKGQQLPNRFFAA